MPNDPCPERDQISAYMLGKLTEEEEEKLGRHLGQCERCQAIADEVENATDDLVAMIREPALVGGYLGEPQLQRAMGRVEAVAFGGIGSGGQAASSLSDETIELENVGQYEVLQRVARGGMGTVYKARHAKLDRIVALKVLSEDRIRDTNALERFDREMKAIGKLDHPNIVRAVDAGESDDVHYLAMDFIDGYDLSKVVKHLDNLPVADACEIVRQAAVGLQYIHENGLIHRDIKPSNLMIDSTGRVRLLDLGLALLWEEQAEDTHLTATGTLMGTYDYMSPEQCGDSHNVDIRSDLYGLGCTLYELLCGTPPFSGPEMDTRGKKIAAHLQTPVPPIRDRCPEVSEELAEVLDRLLAKDPADRFATPAELAAALESLTTDSDLPGLLESMESQPEALVDTAESHTNTVEHASSHAVSTDSGKEPEKAALPASLPPRRRWRWIAVAAGLGGCVFLGVILTLTNRHGTLTIETDDPNVQVAVKQAGELVEVLDVESGWTIRLDSGKYDVEMKGGQDRFKLDNDTVTVTRGDEVRVRVTLKRSADKPTEEPQVAEGPKPAEVDNDPDRAVARWVVSHGGEVTVRCKDKTVEASHVADFPSEPFSVLGVDMNLCAYKTTDADVTQFLSLKELEGLKFNETELTNDGLRQISQIPGLRLLWCRSGSFTDEGIKHLARMPKLHNISLTFCAGLTERGLTELCNPHMQFLYLSGQPITDTFMRNLSRCPQLSQIHLNATQISDAGLVPLSGLQSLTVLHLAETNITDAGVAQLAGLESLRSLELSYTKVTDSGIAELAKCRALQELIVSHTPITDKGLSELAALPNLKTLHAEATKVTDAGVASFRQARPGCAVYYGPDEDAQPWPSIKIGPPVPRPKPVPIDIKPEPLKLEPGAPLTTAIQVDQLSERRHGPVQPNGVDFQECFGSVACF